jgi:hypothetical protein
VSITDRQTGRFAVADWVQGRSSWTAQETTAATWRTSGAAEAETDACEVGERRKAVRESAVRVIP